MSDTKTKQELQTFDSSGGGQLIQDQVSRGLTLIEKIAETGNVEQLSKMMELQREWEAQRARQAFVWANSEFRKNAPVLTHDKKVSYHNNKNQLVEYSHTTLGHLIQTCSPVMSQYGLTHRWETELLDQGLIRVTCYLTHELGHEKCATLQASRDDSGSKNNIQAMGSTITYLQRYTLLAVLGMAGQEDDDGEGHERIENRESTEGVSQSMSDDQINRLYARIEETGTNKDGLIKRMRSKYLLKNASIIEDIPANLFEDAMNEIERNEAMKKKLNQNNEGEIDV